MLGMARLHRNYLYRKSKYANIKKNERKKRYARHDTKTENNAFDDERARHCVNWLHHYSIKFYEETLELSIVTFIYIIYFVTQKIKLDEIFFCSG